MPSETETAWRWETGDLRVPGSTDYRGQLRSSGAFTVWRIAVTKRMAAKLKAIKAELRRRKHHRTSEVGEWLRKVVLGHYQTHAAPGNSSQLRLFRRRVCRLGPMDSAGPYPASPSRCAVQRHSLS